MRWIIYGLRRRDRRPAALLAARRHAEALDMVARTAIERQRTPWVGGRNPWWVA